MVKISLIAAISENRILSDSTKEHIRVGIPWDIPTDVRHFQTKTWRHPVILGRKSYAAFNYPLPNRINIIVSRNRDYQAPGCIVFHSLTEAVEWTKMSETEEIFIAGGGEIFTEAIKFADKMYLTIVEGHFEGDVYFPEFSNFGQVTKEEPLEENGFRFRFVEIER